LSFKPSKMETLPKQMIKFVCISDTHTKTSTLTVPDGDVLIHAGDFSYTGTKKEIEEFSKFIERLPHPHKVIIAGNHDLTFDIDNYNDLRARFHRYDKQMYDCKAIKDMIISKFTYLEDNCATVCGYKIFGSPWTPVFYDWGFNLPKGKPLLEKWKQIPSDAEIVITHGPPYGILDECTDGVLAGCEDLKNELLNRVKPLYHIFGHIHEGYGVKKIDNTTFINASTCTYSYKPNNAPIVFELPVKDQKGTQNEINNTDL